MQFVKALRDRIRSGEITCSVRLWQRPHVKAGGSYPLAPGHIVVTSLLEISLTDVTPELARRSGFVGMVDLLKIATHGPGRRVFLVEFRYVGGGPRPPVLESRDPNLPNFKDANMEKSASELISERIAELGDWRGKTLGRMRKLIKEADPAVVEEWKWMGTPIWSHDGIICTGESYKKVVKLTFAKGASLKDPSGLFNSSLDGNVRRAIDIHEGETVDEAAFKALVRQAVAFNGSGKKKPAKKSKS